VRFGNWRIERSGCWLLVREVCGSAKSVSTDRSPKKEAAWKGKEERKKRGWNDGGEVNVEE
jgi:hypothetical protein